MRRVGLVILVGCVLLGCGDEEMEDAEEAAAAQAAGPPPLAVTVVPTPTTPLCFQGTDCPK